MSHITIHRASASPDVAITVDDRQHQQAEAFLLGKNGEELQRISLVPGTNILPLTGYGAGVYSIRVETVNEIQTRQLQTS